MIAPRLNRPGLWPGRSNVLAHRGVACTSQPLASAAALDILRHGGNAIDAAIAASAVQAAVEPLGTGVGGDMFALYWSAKEKKLKALNGSGACPQKLSWRTFARKGIATVPSFGWASATVPGCVDGWWQLHQADGKLPWKNLFDAAIDYCRNGAPLSEVISVDMRGIAPRLQNDAARAIFTPGGKPPEYGQLFKQTDLAQTLERIAAGGVDAFYKGEIAEQIVRSSDAGGGFFAASDFANHTSLWQTPLKISFQGVDVCGMPPNSQGVTALLALNILNNLDLERLRDDWIALSHAQLESIKLAFAERDAHIADPAYKAPLDQLLALTFATHIGMTVDPNHAIARQGSLTDPPHGDTVSICTADADGNMVSLISSLYQKGCGVVAEGTGIHFHNRASSFTLEPGHPNQMNAGKRPFHTLMPGFAMMDGQPYMAFGSTGGHHQPQAQFQFLTNFLLHGMTLQEAVSAPRFDFRMENYVAFERDFPEEVRLELAAKGHKILEDDVGPFGGAQALRRLSNGVYEAASDPRKDGCAIGF